MRLPLQFSSTLPACGPNGLDNYTCNGHSNSPASRRHPPCPPCRDYAWVILACQLRPRRPTTASLPLHFPHCCLQLHLSAHARRGVEYGRLAETLPVSVFILLLSDPIRAKNNERTRTFGPCTEKLTRGKMPMAPGLHVGGWDGEEHAADVVLPNFRRWHKVHDMRNGVLSVRF